MIIAILTIAVAMYWMLRETDYLRIRLESTEYQRQQLAKSTVEVLPDNIIPEPQAVKVKLEPIRLIPQYCERTKLQAEWAAQAGSRYRHSDTWVYGTGYNVRRLESYQTMTIGKQAITLNATLPNLYEIIAEVTRATTEKPRKASVKVAPFSLNLIEQVRTGSHNEFHATDDKGHGWNQTVTDFETVYHDCLVSKDWLKKHEHDLDGYEPTIEITVDGGKNLSVNGNYKQGLIKSFMVDYVTKSRIGRKSVNLDVGIADKINS